jgi:hypothetical protein
MTHGVNIKGLAEYCCTSVAMIEKHCGKYIGGDSQEQFFVSGRRKNRNFFRNPI